ETAYAIADGDGGHAYECLKMMLVTFAGSTHSKYTTYLMETIVNLELESSPSMREAILNNWLVNVVGREGHWIEGDLMQEHFNLNIEDIVRLKAEAEISVGLQPKSSTHTSPKTRTEIWELLRIYKDTHLHSF
ncbi:hypothetical protein NEOLEDRAFT_1080374, partial [Neolentinus lepideus HHB14362 ss-1]